MQPNALSGAAQVESIRRASRELIRELGFLHRGDILGLTHSECHALIELGQWGHLGMSELAELLRLDKSTTSRLLTSLASKRLVAQRRGKDARQRLVRLTEKGRQRLEAVHDLANAQVSGALEELSEEDRAAVERGLQLYGRALKRRRHQGAFTIRPIEPRDDAAIEGVIRTVMTSFGAEGPGFSINDPEVSAMSAAYRGTGSAYLVVERDDRVIGGGGIAPLEGGEPRVCEVKKMYFLPEARGVGVGRRLLLMLLELARGFGYDKCYLETLRSMEAARALYERCGFSPRSSPLGETGHFRCDAWYERAL